MNDKKWLVLLSLFLARCVMGMQFESVGALAPLLRADGIDYGRMGLLLGAYLAPGIAVCLPGGMIASKFGDRRTLLASLALMMCGGVIEIHGSWVAYLSGRLLAGTGGIVMTVAATKIIADRFTGKQMALAMANFVNAWPCGIALSLVSLPSMAQSFGLPSTRFFLALIAGFALLSALLFIPPSERRAAEASESFPQGAVLLAVCVAGTLWGLANSAFATVFTFGPVLLVEKGYSANAAASCVSIVLWMSLLSIPVGGVLASRLPGPGTLIVLALLAAAAALAAVPRVDASTALFVMIGMISGLPGGAMMTLPARVMDVRSRAIGMGIFYSVSYSVMLGFPILQGALARSIATAVVTFDAAAIAMLVSIPVLGLFVALARGSSSVNRSFPVEQLK